MGTFANDRQGARRPQYLFELGPHALCLVHTKLVFHCTQKIKHTDHTVRLATCTLEQTTTGKGMRQNSKSTLFVASFPHCLLPPDRQALLGG